MESLSYAITSLLLGGLPWSELGETETSEICHWKTSLPGRKLCAGYSAVFGDFVDYCRGLEFTEHMTGKLSRNCRISGQTIGVMGKRLPTQRYTVHRSQFDFIYHMVQLLFLAFTRSRDHGGCHRWCSVVSSALQERPI